MIRGRFEIECNGKIFVAHNTPTHEGVKHFMETAVDGSAPDSGWKFGFVATAGFSGYDPTDTLASHPGWTAISQEFTIYGIPDDVVIAPDNLSASEKMRLNSGILWNPIAARGVFMRARIPGTDILWATADLVEGPIDLSAGAEVSLRYIVTLGA